MNRQKSLIIAMILALLVTGPLSRPAELPEEENLVSPTRVSGKIVIDGELKEEAWTQPALTPPFKTILPTSGQEMAVKTLVWAAYNNKNLYFAFRCPDPEPEKIKSSITQRDNIVRDDQVGIILDAMGTRQASYDFYVNPYGIQADAVSSSVKGGDISADFVWESAGKITADGYQVEIRIPLASIRYQAGRDKNNEVKMRVFFYRSIPHLGIRGYWPAMSYWGQMEFNAMATLVYRDLKKDGQKLEILPNFTFSSDRQRIQPDQWNKSTDTDVGVGIKYGITSSITAEAAVNPDFSQVESDAFQVEVNRRYPLFYSEKRPFFMESKEVLEFTTIKESMLLSAVHTRRIVDPGWAAKTSGSSGNLNFAILAANDRSAGRAWENGLNPYEGKSALFGIFRAKYNIGGDNFVGILYSGRHLQEQRNDVVGADLKYRFSKYLKGSLSYLYTVTRADAGSSLETGSGINAMLEYYSPKLVTWGIYERYSTGFSIATAFQNRVGISRGACGIGPIFFVNLKALPWLKRIIPFMHYYRLYDLGTGLTDISREFAVNFGFSPNGELNLEYWHENEAWAGSVFTKKYFHSVGYLQLFKWVRLYEDIAAGDQIYYHPTTPFVGKSNTFNIGLILNPGTKLEINLDYLYSDFREKQGSQKIYSLDIYNLYTTYQFNRYFFLRGILRYDNLQDKLLTDFLASFTLIPGTVVHLGYGSLYLSNRWREGMWVPGGGELLKMREGLFFKASYLWQIKK
jgi:hypothetical protein